jgi:hypothetical protein
VVFLGLALAGLLKAAASHRSERFGTLVALNWLSLLALRAMPHVPGHDGVRLFLPAFGMLAILAGLGAGEAVARLGRWGKLVVSAAVIEGVVSVAVMMPVPLSYYSPAVGGLPGASRLGMEPTYYWDAMTPEVLGWIDANTPPGGRVVTPTFPTSFLFLNESGRVRTTILPRGPGQPAWYVLQNRPGNLDALDEALTRVVKPVYVYEKLGVPLLWVFRIKDVEILRGAGGDRSIILQDPAR